VWKSSAAKKAPAKLQYNMTDEENTIIVAADVNVWKSSAAKKAPAKLPYHKTDEESAIFVAADVKHQLEPKWPPPKQYIPPGTVKHFVDMLERPRPEGLASDYDRSIIQSHNANVQQSRGSSASRKIIPLLGEQKNKSLPPSTCSSMMIRRRHD
jgi:hypothetical protein